MTAEINRLVRAEGDAAVNDLTRRYDRVELSPATQRIGSGEIAAASCLTAFINATQRDLPGVMMEVDLDLTARMLEHLIAGTIDIAFLAGPVTLPGILTAPIGSVELCWVAAPHLAASGMTADTPVWALPSLSPLHDITVDSLAAAGLPHRNPCGSPRRSSS